MSNLSQFLGQYSGSFSEIFNNGSLDMAGSKVNRFIAFGNIDLINLDATKAYNNSYLSIESVNKISASTSLPPSKTQGVQVNFPTGTPQLLIDNSLPQGSWKPYLQNGDISSPFSSRVTYGRSTKLDGSGGLLYRASLVLNSSTVLLVFVVNDGFKLFLYNINSKVIITSLTVPGSNVMNPQYIQEIGSIVNLFSVATGHILMTVGHTNQIAGNLGIGAISIFYTTTSLSLGPSNMTPTTWLMRGGDSTNSLGAMWAQVSPTNFVVSSNYGAAGNPSMLTDVYSVSVNTTTGAISYSSSSLQIGGVITDFVTLPSVGVILLTGNINPSISVVPQLISAYVIGISGTSTPTLITAPTIFNIANNACLSAWIHQINSTSYMVGAKLRDGPNWVFRSFSFVSNTLTPGTLYNFASDGDEGLAKDFSCYYRTDALKIGVGKYGPGAQYIPSTNTLLIPKSASSVVSGVSSNVMALTINGTVVSIPGSVIPNIGAQIKGVGKYMLYPDYSSGGINQILVSDSAGAYSQGRKLILSGASTTVESSNFINDSENPLSISNYAFKNNAVVNINNAFGYIRYGSNMKRYIVESSGNISLPGDQDVFPVVALTLNGSIQLVSYVDTSLTTSSINGYIVDGIV